MSSPPPQPTIGRLADTFGRKPFMIMAPYAAIVLKILVLLKPSVMMLTVERIVCDLLRVISGTTMGQVAINDIVPRDSLSVAYAQQQAYTAIGILGAPLIGSLMSARGTYYAAIALAAVQLASDQFMLKETLPKDQRKPFAGIANPFDLIRLFTTEKTLTQASTVMSLQFLMDNKILADPEQVYKLDTLGWSREFMQVRYSIHRAASRSRRHHFSLVE